MFGKRRSATEVTKPGRSQGSCRCRRYVPRRSCFRLRKGPRDLFILDTANPSRYLEIRGDAQIEPDDTYSFAAKVGAKYGADLLQMDSEGQTRVAVTIRPTRINAVDLSAG